MTCWEFPNPQSQLSCLRKLNKMMIKIMKGLTWLNCSRRKNKSFTGFRSTSSAIQSAVNVSDNGTTPYLVWTLFLSAKWSDPIRPMQEKSPKSTVNNPVDVICKIMRFVQLSDLHVHVHFHILDTLAALLLVGTCFIDRVFKYIMTMERFIVPIRSPTVAILSEYTPLEFYFSSTISNDRCINFPSH